MTAPNVFDARDEPPVVVRFACKSQENQVEDGDESMRNTEEVGHNSAETEASWAFQVSAVAFIRLYDPTYSSTAGSNWRWGNPLAQK